MSNDPTRWYAHHLEVSTSCKCTEAGPSDDCDQGEALFRVAARAFAQAMLLDDPMRVFIGVDWA